MKRSHKVVANVVKQILFLSPSLCFLDRSGFSAASFRFEAHVWLLDQLVFLHIVPLVMGWLLPLLSDAPAGARASEPDAFVILFKGERGIHGGELCLLLLQGWDA